jgi:hypothetical protein
MMMHPLQQLLLPLAPAKLLEMPHDKTLNPQVENKVAFQTL